LYGAAIPVTAPPNPFVDVLRATGTAAARNARLHTSSAQAVRAPSTLGDSAVALKSDVRWHPSTPGITGPQDTHQRLKWERWRRVLFRVVVRLAKATAMPRVQKILKRVLLAAPLRIESVKHANDQRNQQTLTRCTSERGVHQNRLL